MVNIVLNGVEREVPDGINLIEAARLFGVEIPHYCWHPALPPNGNCRMCVVEIEGVPKLQTSCTTLVSDGMVVDTESERVIAERKHILEFLLANHPIDCPICDQAGECFLQDYYMKHGLHESRVEVDEKTRKQKRVDLGPLVVLDAERCILCGRCVRYYRDILGRHDIVIKNRGGRSEITTFPGKKLETDYSGNVIDLCPVGALTSRDFRFKARVWFLETAESICPGCERGCNIHIDQYRNEVQRFRPRSNKNVNNSWICDTGRLDYRWIGEKRVQTPEGPRSRITAGEADALAADLLKGARSPLILVSPLSSNETLFALKSLRDEAFPSAVIAGGSFREPWEDDGFLKKPDRNPNRKGMEILGLAGDVECALRSDPDVVLLVENDIVEEKHSLGELLAGRRVIVLSPSRNATTKRAELIVPVTTFAEAEGSWTNWEGRTQEFHPALAPVGEARPVFEIVMGIASELGADLKWNSFGKLRAEMIRSFPALGTVREEGGRDAG